ncbi:hypothetical protein H310_05761 [Aphanomyces invadans]|uniref:Uncharacterized protein n=1 Tax=Aphanomyces invadans TaxID=157072 RepID=A0A024U7E7_9STRA|nr:hypothetical protein H310_05761 [Aphanomyces invadans]ETW02194.1 hypothetical protein H310_05761 [Aphanomyces invadans]|eukprot:XP_008868799.1 hypothetical protein H310_05761 [Aphanomyces invadans]
MLVKDALEAELARELAALHLDEDDESGVDGAVVVEPYRRLDLNDLLAREESANFSIESETWHTYAAATAKCDADLFAILEASLQDLQTCTIPVISSRETSGVSIEIAVVPEEHVFHDLQDDEGAILCCPDHCTPLCLGPCTIHCGPRCVHLHALQAADAKAQVASAAENHRLMQLALASVAQIAATVRHDMAMASTPAPSLTTPSSSPLPFVAPSNGISSSVPVQQCAQNVATPPIVTEPELEQAISSVEDAPPAPAPMTAWILQLTEERQRRLASTRSHSSDERLTAADRLVALRQTQVELEEGNRMMAAFAAQVEEARLQRERKIEAEKAAMDRQRMEEEAVAKVAAQREREAAQVAIAIIDMMAEDRIGMVLRRHNQKEDRARREGAERGGMAREDESACERRRVEREVAMRLEAQAEELRQHQIRKKQYDEARRRESAEQSAMEVEEVHQRAVHASIERERQVKEAEKRKQLDLEKHKAEQRKLAAAKHALEEKQRLERLQREAERAEEARRQQELMQAAKQQEDLKRQQDEAIRLEQIWKKQREDAIHEEHLRLKKLHAEAVQRQKLHFQQQVLPATIAWVRCRQQESLARQLMALEEQRSGIIEADDKLHVRQYQLTKWLRRWQAIVGGQRRRRLQSQLLERQRRERRERAAAGRIQSSWRVAATKKQLQRQQNEYRMASAARHIQLVWKKYRLRQRQQHLLDRQMHTATAAAKVQSAYRGFHIRKKLTSALAAIKFVDGDDFDYDEVDLDTFLGGAPELDEDVSDAAGPPPPLPVARPGWTAPPENDAAPSPSNGSNTSLHAMVPQRLLPSDVDASEREFVDATLPCAVEKQAEPSTASSLYKRMQIAIAHGRKGGKGKAAKGKDSKSSNNNSTSNVVKSVTWSSSGKKAKKVNVPSLVDRLRKTTAASR